MRGRRGRLVPPAGGYRAGTPAVVARAHRARPRRGPSAERAAGRQAPPPRDAPAGSPLNDRPPGGDRRALCLQRPALAPRTPSPRVTSAATGTDAYRSIAARIASDDS